MKSKVASSSVSDEPTPVKSVAVVAEPEPAPSEPTPAPPEPEPIDEVSKAIVEVQADPDYAHWSAEHLEVRAIRRLVDECGWELRRAEVAVRSRLY